MISRIKTGSVCSILVLCVLVFLPNIQVNTQPVVGSSEQGADFVPGEVLVKFKSNAKEKNIVDVNGLSVNAKTIKSSKQTDSSGFVKLDLSNKNIDLSNISGLSDAPKISKEQTLEAIKTLKSNPNVEYAEPNYIVKAMAYTSNDPLYLDGTQWGLNNTGQNSGTADKDVNAPEAWDVIGNTAGPKIAILDSGVDYLHEDLACSGYNTDANDNYGHGIHVAGIAAAVGKNEDGGVGTCPNCKILPIKVLNSRGEGTVASVTSGIYVAADQNAKIINMSLGAGGFYSQSMHNAIAYAVNKNIIVVAAAGNCGSSALEDGIPSYVRNGCSFQNQPVYPGSDTNVIAVGSIDRNGNKSSFSNVGSYVSVVAPGSDITSTCLNSSHDNYCSADGTSAATPFVAGGIGLLATINPNLNFYSVKNILQSTAKDIGATGFDTQTGYGIADFAAGVAQAPQTCSSVPTGSYCVEYYNNKDLNGYPVIRQNESGPSISKDFGQAGPGFNIGSDNFSLRYIGNFNFLNVPHEFQTTTDDGVRLYIDNMSAPVINRWQDQGATKYTYLTTPATGQHTLKMEYYENGGGASSVLELLYKLNIQELTDQNNMKGDFVNIITGDFNGDSKTDFIRQEKGIWAQDSINTGNVYLSNGNGTFSSQELTDQNNMKGDFVNIITGDFNGDSKTDFIRQEKGALVQTNPRILEIFSSKGDGTFYQLLTNNYQSLSGNVTNLLFGDFNGESKTDFIKQEKMNVITGSQIFLTT
jgi:thermitase